MRKKAVVGKTHNFPFVLCVGGEIVPPFYGNCICYWTSVSIRGISLWILLAPFLLFYIKKERHMQVCLHFSLENLRALECWGCAPTTLRFLDTLAVAVMLLSPKLMLAVLHNIFPVWNGCLCVWTEQQDQHRQSGLDEGWAGARHWCFCPGGLYLTLNLAGARATVTKTHRKEDECVKL